MRLPTTIRTVAIFMAGIDRQKISQRQRIQQQKIPSATFRANTRYSENHLLSPTTYCAGLQ
jgi:hypothetical protein